ncbi:MAG: ABC transporter substrate-binding protein [Planctomycetota bacterium]|nr:ABC transporter substrate-binding protein [Planctomycetota bacterium]
MTQRSLGTHLLFALSLAGLAVLSGCGGGKPAEKSGAGKTETKTGEAPAGGKFTLTIGCNLELTGDVAPWGQDSKKGIDLAVEAINADPKSPFKIECIYEDNLSQADASKAAIRKLIQQSKAQVVVGSVGSNRSLAAIDVAKDERVPMVTHASTNVDITRKGGEYVFRICFDDDFQGQFMARYALKDLQAKTCVAVVDKGNAYSEGLVASFKKEFEAGGGKVIAEEAYQSKDNDFQTLVTKLRTANPDCVWLPGYFPNVGPIIKQARAAGFQKKFLGGDGWDDEELYKLGGPSIKGNPFCNHFDKGDTNAKVKEFVEAYEKKYGKKPGAMAALGYDVILVVADAAKRAGKADPEAIKDALKTVKDIETVCGAVTMGADHEVTKPAVLLETGETDHVFMKRQ